MGSGASSGIGRVPSNSGPSSPGSNRHRLTAYQNSPLTRPEILCQPSPNAAQPPSARGRSSTAGRSAEAPVAQTTIVAGLATGPTQRRVHHVGAGQQRAAAGVEGQPDRASVAQD